MLIGTRREVITAPDAKSAVRVANALVESAGADREMEIPEWD